MLDLQLKVCGMRNPGNIQDLVESQPHFIGLIFYKKSSRYVLLEENRDTIKAIPPAIKRVGVFVNEPLENLFQLVNDYGLDYVQLHGGESREYCSQVKQKGIQVIKVFSIENQLPIEKLGEFEDLVSYFLFDTKTPLYGGSGQVFNWEILADYPSKVPYFLSGGIGVDELNNILLDKYPGLAVIDVNSKIEIKPGFKDIDKVNEMKQIMTRKKESYESIRKI